MKKKIAQLDRCCILDGYQLCFPTEQEVNNMITSNPFYDFVENKSYWTYAITVDCNEQDLSHWVLAMCRPFLEKVRDEIEEEADIADFFKMEVKVEGGEFEDITDILDPLPNGDPSIAPIDGQNIPVLKTDEPQPADGQTYFYRLTIKDPEYFNLAAEPGIAAIKTGGPPATGFFIFNSYQEYVNPDIPITCTGEDEILGPSLECTRILPPSRGIKLY